MAAGAIRAARSHGLSIPHDLGMVAFDDASWTSLVTPPLTVVRQPTYELGRAAGEVLLNRATPHEAPEDATEEASIHEVLAPELRRPVELVAGRASRLMTGLGLSTPQVGCR